MNEQQAYRDLEPWERICAVLYHDGIQNLTLVDIENALKRVQYMTEIVTANKARKDLKYVFQNADDSFDRLIERASYKLEIQK
jgi:hypothetical protein